MYVQGSPLASVILCDECPVAAQFEHSLTKKQYRVWFESPVVGRPTKDDAAGVADKRLFPRDCREAVRSVHIGQRHTRVWTAKGAIYTKA